MESGADAAGLRDFLRRASALKDTPRNTLTPAGRRESAAEHSWRLGLIALVAAPEGLDLGHALALCLVHDLAEAVTGDIPASARPDPVAKQAAERAALADLLASAPEAVRARVTGLWEEYEAAHTPEARFVRAADKLETVLAHAEGDQPPGFDWRFNLGYGKGLADAFPTLAALRALADAETARRAEQRADETPTGE